MMHGLALLSPINESEELSSASPYRARFGYGRQLSPIGTKGSLYNVRDATKSPLTPVDDLWIYDCYASEDTTSPASGYPRSPATPSHNRSISLPATTVNYIPPNNIPLIKEPTLHRPPPLYVPARDSYQDPAPAFPVEEVVDNHTNLDLPSINTTVVSVPEFPEYSPLAQEAYTVLEVIDQLAAAVDQLSGLENVLSQAGAVSADPEDEDTMFWFIEALNMFVSDCTEVAVDLMQFSEFVEALLMGEGDRRMLPVRPLPRASFSERDMHDVLASAASIPEFEVSEALAQLEAAVPPSPIGSRQPRERPPSLKLSTSDAVLLQATLQPRSRNQSVGALGRFVDQGASRDKDDTLKKHRAYVIIGDETPVEDNWSAKSIVEFSFSEGQQYQQAERDEAARPRPTTPGLDPIPRPLSSPMTLAGAGISFPRGRPPPLALNDPLSPRSSHSTSSSVSSLFSALPRSSFSTSSPTSPRQSMSSFDKVDKPRFPTSSVKFKKMFTNIFKNKEREAPLLPSLRSFGRRTAGTGSIDATLSALSLSGMSSTASPLAPERDPFAATPPTSAALRPPSNSSDLSGLDGYSSMFNSLKAASRHPTQPLFGGVGTEDSTTP